MTSPTLTVEEGRQRLGLDKPRLRDRVKARIDRLPGPPLFHELLLWYSLTWPMLFIRVPLIYFLYNIVGLPLWAAIITQFAIERPVFYLVASRIVYPTAKG